MGGFFLLGMQGYWERKVRVGEELMRHSSAPTGLGSADVFVLGYEGR